MSNIDPVMLGREIAGVIKEKFAQEMQRVIALETRLQDIENRLTKCMTYAGEFQSALDYKAGTLVRANGRLLVATKDIHAGASGGTRDGSGWEKIMDTRDHT